MTCLGLCLSGKWEWKVTYLAQKFTYCEQPDSTYFKLCVIVRASAKKLWDKGVTDYPLRKIKSTIQKFVPRYTVEMKQRKLHVKLEQRKSDIEGPFSSSKLCL